MPNGENRHGTDNSRSVRPVVTVAAMVFGAVGIALQQLATGWPASPWHWVMLAIGSLIGGTVGILATGVFDRTLVWVARSIHFMRIRARSRSMAMIAMACVVALGAGFVVQPASSWIQRRIHGCAQPTLLTVLTSKEELASTRQLVKEYESWTALTANGCPTVSPYVFDADDSDVRKALSNGWSDSDSLAIGPQPDVWIPASSFDVEEAESSAEQANPPRPLPIRDRTSIAYSPVILAVPSGQVKTELLGKEVELAWADLWNTAKDRDWKLVRPNPQASIVGVVATAALYSGITKTGNHEPDEDTARRIEASLTESLNSAGYPLGANSELLCQLRKQDSGAVVFITTEQHLIRFNDGLALGGACGRDQDPARSDNSLVGFYPTDSISLDIPFVRFAWPGGGRKAADAAVGFKTWLESQNGERHLWDVGLRPSRAISDPTILRDRRGVVTGFHSAGVPLSSKDVKDAMRRHESARMPASVLIVLDASGSMESVVVGTTDTRLRHATGAVKDGLVNLGAGDRFGVNTFSTRSDGDGAVTTLVGIDGNDEAHRRDAVAKMARVMATGGTPLYDAINGAISAITDPSLKSEGWINSIVVLTDGVDTSSGDTAAQLKESARRSPVRVFVLAIGEANCGGETGLRELAESSGGYCREVTDASLGAAVGSLFTKLRS